MNPKMTTTTKIPVTAEYAAGERDTLAGERARTAITELHREVTGPHCNGDTHADRMGAAFADAHAVGWEHAINSSGVTVRRYVARSAWEIDPAAVNP